MGVYTTGCFCLKFVSYACCFEAAWLVYHKKKQFYVGPDRFVVRDVFLRVFLVDLLLQYRMGMQEHTFPSRHFDLSGRSSVLVCVLLPILYCNNKLTKKTLRNTSQMTKQSGPT